MPYVIAATWTVKPGEVETVLDLLERNAAESRQEPGCILFWIHRAVDDPRTFFLYEQYESQDALAAHSQTEHFQRYVLGDAVNRLESRRRQIYEVVSDGAGPQAMSGDQR